MKCGSERVIDGAVTQKGQSNRALLPFTKSTMSVRIRVFRSRIAFAMSSAVAPVGSSMTGGIAIALHQSVRDRLLVLNSWISSRNDFAVLSLLEMLKLFSSRQQFPS